MICKNKEKERLVNVYQMGQFVGTLAPLAPNADRSPRTRARHIRPPNAPPDRKTGRRPKDRAVLAHGPPPDGRACGRACGACVRACVRISTVKQNNGSLANGFVQSYLMN
jgi:hypothetical protein